MSRISCPILQTRVTSAELAAEAVHPGGAVGVSGFTGAGFLPGPDPFLDPMTSYAADHGHHEY